MRIKDIPNCGTRVWISARETYAWAHKPGARWPCSTLSNKRLFAAFDTRGDLVNIAINGRSDADCSGAELDALLEDLIGSAHPEL